MKRKPITMEQRFNYDFYEFQSYEAQARLNLGWLEYSPTRCRMVDLINEPECYFTKELKQAKKAALDAIEHLKACVAGQVIDMLYLYQWECLKGQEWPEWRK